MTDEQVVKELLRTAKLLVAAPDDDEGEVDDPNFVAKVRALKMQLPKLSRMKRKKLNSLGIGMIRPTATVEDLVDALALAASGV